MFIWNKTWNSHIYSFRKFHYILVSVSLNIKQKRIVFKCLQLFMIIHQFIHQIVHCISNKAKGPRKNPSLIKLNEPSQIKEKGSCVYQGRVTRLHKGKWPTLYQENMLSLYKGKARSYQGKVSSLYHGKRSKSVSKLYIAIFSWQYCEQKMEYIF